MKYLILPLAALTILSAPAKADTLKNIEADIAITVSGMVCDFCAQALTKVMTRRADIHAIDVNLDTHLVTIDTVEGAQIDDETLKKLVTDSGYTPLEIQRKK